MIGFAHGYSYLTVIVHASEIVHQKLRGMIVTSLQMCIILSALLTSTFTTTMGKEGLMPFQWIGITGVVYSVLGIIFTLLMTQESPVQLMQQKKFDQALNIMVKVRNESSETWSIKNEYNELKAMVEEDSESSHNIYHDGNMRPLMLITLLRIAFVVSFNYGLNMIRLKYTSAFITDEGFNLTGISYLSIRSLVMIFTLFSIELNGRKLHFIVSHGGTAILFVIFGAMAFIQPTTFAVGYEIIQILIEITAGIGMGVLSDVYSSEAFNTVKKARSIFITTAIEYALHIAIIWATFNVSSSSTYDGIFLLASGGIFFALTYVLRKELPETAKMSIRQTSYEFLKQGEIVFSGSNRASPKSITFS